MPMVKPPNDNDYMAMAIALSMRSRGNSGSNPNVGCVIVKNQHIIGRGWTQIGGRPHAEAAALAIAGDKAKGADIYTTLEPCYHQSQRGPDCASTIIAAQPARLIYALTDPDPRTNGKGLDKIQSAGIAMTGHIQSDKARHAMAGFFTRFEKKRPFITLKLAISLDGCIAMENGQSQWITSDIARQHSHLERAYHDAILVGSGTVKADNPRLDVRLEGLEGRAPIRYQLGASKAPAGWKNIASLDEVSTIPYNHLMVEGGAKVASAFLRADMIDRLLLYRAPIIIGAGKSCISDYGLDHLKNAHGQWALQKNMIFGKDILEIYERQY